MSTTQLAYSWADLIAAMCDSRLMDEIEQTLKMNPCEAQYERVINLKSECTHRLIDCEDLEQYLAIHRGTFDPKYNQEQCSTIDGDVKPKSILGMMK